DVLRVRWSSDTSEERDVPPVGTTLDRERRRVLAGFLLDGRPERGDKDPQRAAVRDDQRRLSGSTEKLRERGFRPHHELFQRFTVRRMRRPVQIDRARADEVSEEPLAQPLVERERLAGDL